VACPAWVDGEEVDGRMDLAYIAPHHHHHYSV